MKTLNEQHKLIKEGKGHKDVFLKEAKTQFPQWIRNAATYKEATTILKDKGIINENLVSLGAVNQSVSPQKESYETAFENFLEEAKKKKEDSVKAEMKEVSKEVKDYDSKNFDRKDMENPDNLIFDQVMKGYYTEMKNPKNSEKTMDELKKIVFKNLAKDSIYYTKNGQFGVEDLGYETEAPGLGRGTQVKDAGPGGGYGTPTKKKFPEGDVGTGYIEVPKKIKGSGLEVINVTTLNENVQKELKSIDKEAEVETIKIKIERIETAIEKRQTQLSKLDEDEDLKNLTDKKKLKALGKDIKVLEKAKAKLEKTLAKLIGKKKKEVLDEDESLEELDKTKTDVGELNPELEKSVELTNTLKDTLDNLEEDDNPKINPERAKELAIDAENDFDRLTGGDNGLSNEDALENILSQIDANKTDEYEFVEKHLMFTYNLGSGNA